MFKLLKADGGQSKDGDDQVWSLPTHDTEMDTWTPGDWHEAEGELVPDGFFVTTDLVRWWFAGARAYYAECGSDITSSKDGSDAMAKRLRLLRPLTAAECAERNVFIEGAHEIGGRTRAVADRTAYVTARRSSAVIAVGSASVKAYDDAEVFAYNQTTVQAYGDATVNAHHTSTVTAAGESRILAFDLSTVSAYGSSTVAAHGRATVTAHASATVISTRSHHRDAQVLLCDCAAHVDRRRGGLILRGREMRLPHEQEIPVADSEVASEVTA
jgi:hypothetical protein